MTLIDTHIGQSNCKRGKRLSQRQLDEYDRVQRLIEEIQVDLVNGVLRSEIFNMRISLRRILGKGKSRITSRQLGNY